MLGKPIQKHIGGRPFKYTRESLLATIDKAGGDGHATADALGCTYKVLLATPIQKRLRRNINLISDYMCEHGLARKMRKALAA